MIKQYSYGDITWYDLESPTLDEIEKLGIVYQLDSATKEDLLTPTIKPKAENYPTYLYVILHFPVLKSNIQNKNREIDFVIGENFIITTHYDTIDPLHQFTEMMGSKNFPLPLSSPRTKKVNGGVIFYQMIGHMYHSLIEELEILSAVLNRAEKSLFSGKEKSMLIALSKINRDLLDFKAATNLHRSILESFEHESVMFFGKEFETYSKKITNEYYKVATSIQESKDFLEELRRTNDSLLSNKQNEIMKTLSVLAFIFLPLSLIAGIFGMNVVNMPIVSLPNSFIIIISGMIGLALCTLLFARLKEWL